MEDHDANGEEESNQDPIQTTELCAQSLTEGQTEYVPMLKRIATEDESEGMRAKRARNTTLSLTRRQEANLAKWFKDHEIFYNKKLGVYKDIDERNRLLTEKALELNCYPGQLRSWLDNMRTRYGRLSATHSTEDAGEMTERERWIFENFEFLRPHIVRCPTRQAKKIQETFLDMRLLTTPQLVQKPSTSIAPAVFVKNIMNDEEETPTAATGAAGGVGGGEEENGLLEFEDPLQPFTPTASIDVTARRKHFKTSPSTALGTSTNEELLNKLQEKYSASLVLQSQIATLLHPVNENEARVVNYTNYLASLCRQMSPRVFRSFQRHTTSYALDLLEDDSSTPPPPPPPVAPPVASKSTQQQQQQRTGGQTALGNNVQQLHQAMSQFLQNFQQLIPQQ